MSPCAWPSVETNLSPLHIPKTLNKNLNSEPQTLKPKLLQAPNPPRSPKARHSHGGFEHPGALYGPDFGALPLGPLALQGSFEV